MLPSHPLSQEGYGVMVLNPNENYLEVEKTSKSTRPPPTEVSDEPAEKRERKDDKERKRREFYEKYRNPQKEMETEQIPIRVCQKRTAAKACWESREQHCRLWGDVGTPAR